MATLNRPKGAAIYYDTQGEYGPWITLINGHTRTASDFRQMARFLVSQNIRVLLFDHRGFGQSRAGGNFTAQDMVDDVSALWQECGIERSSVLGISLGGILAQMLALQYPAKLKKLVLVSTAPAAKLIQSLDSPWQDNLSAIASKLNNYFSDDFLNKNRPLIQAMAKQIVGEIGRSEFLRWAEVQRKAIQSVDLTDEIGTIKVPTLIIHGAKDQIIPLRAAEILAEMIPNSRKQIFPDAGHLLIAEVANDLYQAVWRFVNVS